MPQRRCRGPALIGNITIDEGIFDVLELGPSAGGSMRCTLPTRSALAGERTRARQ